MNKYFKKAEELAKILDASKGVIPDKHIFNEFVENLQKGQLLDRLIFLLDCKRLERFKSEV